MPLLEADRRAFFFPSQGVFLARDKGSVFGSTLFTAHVDANPFSLLPWYKQTKLPHGARMKVISLISQKGGSGKTTLAVHLAVYATMNKKAVVLIDLDPQGSAVGWYKIRDIESELAAVQSSATRLSELLKKAQTGGADLVIIDTAGHSDKEAAAAARVSDFVLIPCRPELFDMLALSTTFDILNLSKTPSAIVMNGCPRGKVTDDAREALRGKGYNVLDLAISDRVAFKHAIRDGRSVHEYDPESVAAADVAALFSFVKDKVNL